MSALREAAQQALEALEWHYRQGHSNTLGGFRLKIDEKALRNLRAALAQEQAEPAQDLAQEPVTPTGYLSRVRAQVEEQQKCFPGEEPDYLWTYNHGTKNMKLFEGSSALEVVRLYTAPPRRTMVPLTAQQLDGVIERHVGGSEITDDVYASMEQFARAIEKASWEKNK